MEELKQCPQCRLVNPSTAPRCDCGYDFAARQMLGSHLNDKNLTRTAEDAQALHDLTSNPGVNKSWSAANISTVLFLMAGVLGVARLIARMEVESRKEAQPYIPKLDPALVERVEKLKADAAKFMIPPGDDRILSAWMDQRTRALVAKVKAGVLPKYALNRNSWQQHVWQEWQDQFKASFPLLNFNDHKHLIPLSINRSCREAGIHNLNDLP